MDRFEYIAIGVMLAIFFTSFAFMAKGWSDCSAQNGSYVRTVFWYECIEGDRDRE